MIILHNIIIILVVSLGELILFLGLDFLNKALYKQTEHIRQLVNVKSEIRYKLNHFIKNI